jgi:hypothetical protein
MRKVLTVGARLALLAQLSFPGFRTVSISVLLALALVSCTPTPRPTDEQVAALVRELRDQPRARQLGCTPCVLQVYPSSSQETPEDARR